jgi:acetyl esterase/lipase
MKTVVVLATVLLSSFPRSAAAQAPEAAPPGQAATARGGGRGRGGPAPAPAGTTVIRDLVFTKIETLELSLELYRPEKFTGDLPVVVWTYGSAWAGGGKNAQAASASWLAQHGYAVAVIDHRGSGVAPWPAQAFDVKAAVRWLRANAKQYSLDPARFAAWGESSGGHLSSILGLTGDVAELEGNGGSPGQSSRVQAVIDFFGPSDFLQMEGHKLTPNAMGHDAATSPESRLVGGAIQENKDKVARANPLTYLTPDDPPFLIVHGEQDPLVPFHQSELMYEALKQAGRDVTFYKIAGAGHGGAAFYNDLTKALVLAFLDRTLKARN